MAVTNAFVKGMCEGGEYESEIINISDLNVTPCKGCLSCWARTEGECVIKNDDMPAVKKRIEEADIIIESYPLYFWHARTDEAFHRQTFKHDVYLQGTEAT